MRALFLLLLSFGLLTACDTQPKATQMPTNGKGSFRPADSVQLPQDSSARQIPLAVPASVILPPPPDSILAFMGSRSMKFASVSDADLHTILFNNGLDSVPLLGRFLLINEKYMPLRLYYQSTHGTGDWIETLLEPMSNGLAGKCEITLDSAKLGSPSSPVVLVTMEWTTGDRSGEFSRRAINLIDISREPRLLLRSETFAGRISSFDHDEEAGPEITNCEQKIILSNHKIVIGEPAALGDETCEIAFLPAERYRYHNGKVLRVGK